MAILHDRRYPGNLGASKPFSDILIDPIDSFPTLKDCCLRKLREISQHLKNKYPEKEKSLRASIPWLNDILSSSDELVLTVYIKRSHWGNIKTILLGVEQYECHNVAKTEADDHFKKGERTLTKFWSQMASYFKL